MCFEHPGLLAPVEECTDDVCITCSDEGSVAEVVSVGDTHATLRHRGWDDRCRHAPRRRGRPGDLVLLHAGTAIARVDAVEDRAS